MSINNDVKNMSRREFCASLDPYVQKWTTDEILQFLELSEISQAHFEEMEPDEARFDAIAVLRERLNVPITRSLSGRIDEKE